MKRLKYLALATLVAFAACDEGIEGGGTTPQTGTVTATVTANGAGVAGVQVNLVGPTTASATTPASGTVTFSAVEQGAYAVTISGVPAGFVCSNTSQTTSVTSGNLNPSVSFACNVVRSASISGQVTANGQAVEGATIEISGPEGTETRQTGAAGTFQFTGLIAGDYDVTLQDAEIGGITCVETTSEVSLDPGEAAVTNFSCGGETTPASVAIERITTLAGVAVDRTMVQGNIVVVVGVDEGGQDVEAVQVFANGIMVCEQTMGAAPVEGPMAVEEEFEIDCVFNTAAVRNLEGEPTAQFADAGDGLPFEPIFLNGDIEITAVAITESDEDTDPSATATITLTNPDQLALNVENSNPDAPEVIIDPTDGLRWLSGALTFTVYPIIYSAPFDPNNPAIARANFSFDSYVSTEDTDHFTNDADSRPDVGEDATPASWQLSNTTPNDDGSFTFSLPDTHTGGSMSGGVLVIGNTGGVDDLITGDIGAQNIAISTVTAFGQFGPSVICANISTTCVGTGGTVATNPLRIFYEGVLQSGTGAVNNVLRVDNQEPWANTIELRPHTFEANFPGAVTAEGIMTNGQMAVRGGLNLNGFRDGWVNHEYAFGSSMWSSVAATDAPNFYATHPNFTLPTGITASVTPLAGIGVDPTSLEFVAMGSDASNSPSAFTITGISAGTESQRLRNVSGTTVETGADLPGETGLGLDVLTAPNSNERDDISLVAVVADLFENAGITNIQEIAVDGHAPIFRNRLGTPASSPLYPTALGTVYNTYGDEQASNPSNLEAPGQACTGTPPNQVCTYTKAAGIFEGSITDAGNGFSGAAGVSMLDWENACSPAVNTPCVGAQANTRTGVTLQDPAILLPTIVMVWEWSDLTDVGTSTFLSPAGAAIGAYDATAGTSATNDGYRQQQPTARDRADNARTAAATTEHIADKTRTFVGNVEMPTVPVFVLGTGYTYRGEAEDIVDLRYTDFSFDFNTIRSIQPYADELDDSGDPFAPGVDVNAEPYLANQTTAADMDHVGNSIQLPLRDEDHTAFGSAAILLHRDLEVTGVEFVGCIALFDEGGAPDNAFAAVTTYDDNAGEFALAEASDPTFVHRPRGPRWRTWGHEYPEVIGGAPPATYGLINTQFNTFTPSSVPACTMSAAAIRGQISPSASTAGWEFEMPSSTTLSLSVSGPSGTFVPTIDITDVDLYYIDVEGRVRILDTSGANWTGPVVEDVGTGSLGRTYTFTYTGGLPANTLTPEADAGDANGNRHRLPYFFTVRFGNGTAIMWDDSANPVGP